MLNERNYLFDGIRGVAAIGVLLFHVGGSVGSQYVPSGYLAVDLFFVLSGFVISDAYQHRLEHGQTLRTFVVVRLVRLYPLYLAGLAIGCGRYLGAVAIGDPRAPDLATQGAALAFGLFLLPTPLPLDNIFPLNTPSWSLSLEVLVNILFAAGIFRFRDRYLVMLALAGALAMLWGAWLAGSLQIGITWSEYIPGLGRSIWGFFIGVVLARLRARHADLALPWGAAIPVALAVLAILTIEPGPQLRFWFDAAATVVAFPAIVFAAALIRLPGVAVAGAGFLGDISYPLYATHYGLIAPLTLLATMLAFTPLMASVFIPLVCIIVAVVAAGADKYVRRRLADMLAVRQSARPAVV